MTRLPKFGLSLSFQVHPGLGEPFDRSYREAIELAAEANRLGFESIWLSEHHGEADGYCPSPVVAGAALVGAATVSAEQDAFETAGHDQALVAGHAVHRMEEELDIFWSNLLGPESYLKEKLLGCLLGVTLDFRRIVIDADKKVTIDYQDGSQRVVS